MDNLQRASVSLLIEGDDLAPAEISALLGGEPRLAVSMGEVFLGSHGTEIQARTGKWHLGDGWKSPANIDAEIVSMLGSLSDDATVWEGLNNRFDCYIAVGGYFEDWTGGIFLEPGVLRMLADRGLAIDFDLYAPAASAPPPVLPAEDTNL